MASLGAHSGCLNGHGPGGARTDSGTTGGRRLYRDGKLMPGATLEGPKVSQPSFPGAGSVFRLKQTDPKNRIWWGSLPGLLLLKPKTNLWTRVCVCVFTGAASNGL